MLKTRIIPIMLWNGTTLVKGKQFENEKRSAGSAVTTIKIYNSRFQKQMKLWIKKNLSPIIEKEFSIFIKNKS